MGENLLGRNKERGEKWNGYRMGEGDGEKNGGTWQRLEGNEEGDMIKKMEELLRTDIEQTIQKDWVKIDNSTYCPYYRHLKNDISGEEYLYDSTKDEEKKNVIVESSMWKYMARSRQ